MDLKCAVYALDRMSMCNKLAFFLPSMFFLSTQRGSFFCFMFFRYLTAAEAALHRPSVVSHIVNNHSISFNLVYSKLLPII